MRGNAWGLLYVLLFAVIGGGIALWAKSNPRYQVGQALFRPVVARVAFRTVDREQTAVRKRNARELEPAVYNPNDTYLQRVRQKLLALGRLGADAELRGLEDIPGETRVTHHLTPAAFNELRQYIADQNAQPWEQLTDHILNDYFGIAVLSAERATVERVSNQLASKIYIRHPYQDGNLSTRRDEDLVSVDDDPKILRGRAEVVLHHKLPRALRKTVLDILTEDVQPNYVYDHNTTEARRQARFDAEPPFLVIKQPNEVLVEAGRKLSPMDVQLLREEHYAYVESLGGLATYLIGPAKAGVFLVFGLGLWGYFGAYKPRIVQNPTRGLAITALMLAGQAVAVAGTALMPQFAMVTGLFPTLFVSTVLAIVYDQRFALAVGAIHALVVVTSLDLSMAHTLILVAGVGVAVSQLPDVRNRSTLIKVGLWSGLAMAATTLVVQVSQRPLHIDGQLRLILLDALRALGTGFGSGLIVQGLLPGIERIFHVTTSMTLKELNDASHPLLRRMAQDAPGTYQHSLRIADMGEAAAESIGADTLLCRVGAMYHDIGKVNKPLYFAENQAGGPNRHDKLSPAMSLLIIVGHVKDGVELAREFGLPRPLVHFIESHHGTTLVECFYHAAKQQHDMANQPAPAEFEFRYPGPKPQTREAAILMLCDCVEGAARTLDEPTASRIDQLVHAMANKRLMDGQFDECNLTLKELHKIEQSIIKTVCAIYHGRVKYPGGGSRADAANTAQESDATAGTSVAVS